MVGKLISTLLVLVAAAAAAASGFDRLSERNFAYASLVPPGFRGYSEGAAATAAILSEDWEKADEHAVAAVKSDPVDPGSAALLGAVAVERGDFALAEASFRVSAQFGWRDAMTQLYWYRVALMSGDHQVAVQRADAILRAEPRYVGMSDLLAPLEDDPEARPLLLAQLKQEPEWALTYFTPRAREDPELIRRRAIMAAELGETNPIGCEAATNLTRLLVTADDLQLAERVWNTNCASLAERGPPAALNPERLIENLSDPFGWQLARSGDLLASEAAMNDGAKGIQLRNSASTVKLVMSQIVRVPPGRYRMEVDFGDPATEQAQMLASAGCGNEMPFPASLGSKQPGLSVQLPDCEYQRIGLWMRPGDRFVRIKAIRLNEAD